MTRFRFSAALAALLMTSVSAGCGDTTPPAAPFTFNRPERVEFVCFDPAGTSSDSNNPLILPLRCCATDAPLNPTLNFEKGERDDVCGEGDPSLHALVTQSTRGEVAAVDLEEREVLDSDSRIPGYTFVDVGGLPRAIVTPSHMPGNPLVGPPWTYVAGAEEQSLRAVATCHFREGAGCGPEEDLDESTLVLALPSQPRDMLFGPDNSLWLTLPDLGALARVALPTEGNQPFASTKPDFFRMPVLADEVPAEPESEANEYVTACGLGYELSLTESQIAMPLTAPAMGLGMASPTRLRFDEESGLLLVADASQPFVHVLSVDEQGVQVRGHVATGAPIRDFALTPAVPASAAAPLEFADKGAPEFGKDENRYLYAIDDRDGSVLVQGFRFANGKVTATPLRTPASLLRRDRLALTEAATAIDVADNRALTNGYVCDWGRNEAVDEETDAAEDALKEAKDALAAARKAADEPDEDATVAAREAEYEDRLAEYNAKRAERGILDGADAGSLRGVFVMVSTLTGRLNVFDVHDLDIYCRGERWCETPTNLIAGDDDATAVAVRRHAPRLASIADPTLTPTDADQFAPLECDDGRYPAVVADTEPEPEMDPASPTGNGSDAGAPMKPESDAADAAQALLCVAEDPWLQTTPEFYASWEGSFFTGVRGHLTVAEGAAAVLEGPEGFDMCTRGVLGAGLEPGYDGDSVLITGAPPSYAPSDCATPEEGNEPTLLITKSFADRLEVTGKAEVLAKLARCYPDVIQFEVRARGAYMVFPRSGLPPHRIKSAAGGACIADPEKDERLISRAMPPTDKQSGRFSNAFVSFQLPEQVALPARDSLIQMQATTANGRFSQAIYIGSNENTPSLPVSVRYLSVTGDVYVVDTAQGLRRFALTPFGADTTPFR